MHQQLYTVTDHTAKHSTERVNTGLLRNDVIVPINTGTAELYIYAHVHVRTPEIGKDRRYARYMNSLVKHVLLCVEIDFGHELAVDLLLELVLQLLRRLHAVLGRAEDAADAALLVVRELRHVPAAAAALLDDALQQVAG